MGCRFHQQRRNSGDTSAGSLGSSSRHNAARRNLGICHCHHHQPARGNIYYGSAAKRKLTADARQALLRGWLRDLDGPGQHLQQAPSIGWTPMAGEEANLEGKKAAAAATLVGAIEAATESSNDEKGGEGIGQKQEEKEGSKKPIEFHRPQIGRRAASPQCEDGQKRKKGGQEIIVECCEQPKQQSPRPSAPPLSLSNGFSSSSSSGPSTAQEAFSSSTSQVSAASPPAKAIITIGSSSSSQRRLRWIDNMNAKNSVMIALSFFYAMLATIFALVFELSHIIAGDSRNRRSLGLKELIFGLYMYGYSIAFLLYCYFALLLNPRWKRRIGTIVPFQNRTDSSQNIVQQGERKVSHNSPSAGSLFLRLGCVVFGVIGTVYYAFDVFLCISDSTCHQPYLICLDVLAIVFVFTQMHFVFCNWKLTISQRQILCRFGTMHLVATNLWTWIRYILIEESLMGDEIRQVFARSPHMNLTTTLSTTTITSTMATTTLGDSSSVDYYYSTTSNEQSSSSRGTVGPPAAAANPGMSLMVSDTVLATAIVSKRSLMRKCQGAECVLASFNEIMYTSIVEYSLIGAAVMFIVWRNIGKVENPVAKIYVPRKHRIRLDCSKSTTGLFFGLAFLAGTFTSMAVFSGYTIMGQNQLAATLFGFTDIIHYLISTCGCGVALWRMRLLRYHSHQPMDCPNHHEPNVELASRRESSSTKTAITFPPSTVGIISASHCSSTSSAIGHHNNQELLDLILLAFGMTGEMIYSVAGLLGLTGDPNWQPLTIILLAVHITRIMEVGLQSCLIYIAGKLRVGSDPLLRETQPGKQAITFLLLANISMFLMNLLEAEKAGVSETVVNFYGKRSWVFLVRSFSPLAIFYRFHSSVSIFGLAEVWKSTYSWKE